ncbi:MAG: hypothetical protein WDA60_01590 [Acidimicrobiia bacterium]|jgi:hypothetical protein
MSPDPSTPKPSRTKKLVAAAAVTGALLGTTGIAMAQTGSSSGTTDTTTAPTEQIDRSQAVHPGEELLTGDTAAQVTAAAQQEVPDATVDRVETDAEGSPYEAHMTKSDGTHVTVKVDADFNVTGVENDGAGGPRGGAPAGAPQQSTTSNAAATAV